MQRDRMSRTAILYHRSDGAMTLYSTAPSGGDSQYISSLNNVGRFIPNKWRVNPVAISRGVIESADSMELSIPFYQSGIWKRLDLFGPWACYGLTFGNSAINTVSSARVFPAWDTRLASLATVKAFGKVNSPKTFDGGVFFGELAETIHMLKHPFEGLRKFLKSSKSFRSPARLMSAGASTWLEWRYGIQPFASDITSIMQLFTRKSGALENQFFSDRATVSTSSRWKGSASQVIIATLSYVDRGTFDVKYTCGVSYYKKPGIYSNMAQFGFAPHQIPSLLWELTPYSFVVDWFYPIGPWLQAITPDPSVSILGSFVSRKVAEKIVRTCSSATYAGGSAKNPVMGFNLSMDTLERRSGTALPALPVRSIDTMTLRRSIDSVALLWQRLPNAWRHARR